MEAKAANVVSNFQPFIVAIGLLGCAWQTFHGDLSQVLGVATRYSLSATALVISANWLKYELSRPKEPPRV